ncbi:hypothetical protein FVB32_08770 [Flagellimonas hymeniacidonis]|uniref:Secreted protein n=1 Tax=Flagellimonas hymeniacidonis TaxID=2603628 RepID=A0A5C8V9J3_9FLAO|nr:hypothetical protein [Flagellimonas hymeniacidonis]TXN38371.1 hypothetical protein FVB32_08770 [Flagellimonas hymeniacidonis]
MTYKIKSLIYFSCFLIAAFAYNVVEQREEFQNKMQSQEVSKTEFEDQVVLEELQEENADKQE